jgi:DNA repair protein RadC
MQQNLTIKSWAEDDRPREKLMLKGQKTLSDAELLAIIIGSGTPKKSAVELSKELLNSANNNLQTFSKMNLDDLKKHKGIGDAKAISILASLEFGRRRKNIVFDHKTKITSSKIAYEYLRSYFEDLEIESFYIILLNRANKIIKHVQISHGGVSETVADGKIIFKSALENMATGIILSHNHPSGQLNPSQQDIKLTQKLKHFGELIQISILDHLIVTDNGYFSFADEGML